MGIWLDTAIGLVTLFLAMSLVVTAAVEALSQLMSWRAATLRAGIDGLLQSFTGTSGKSALLDSFYRHALITSLSDPRRRGASNPIGAGSGPSYIPARVFAAVLVDIATRNGPAQDLRDSLAAWALPSAGLPEWAKLRDAFTAAEAEAKRLQSREQSLLLDMSADRQGFSAAIAETANLGGAIAAAKAALAGQPVRGADFAPHEATALQLCGLLERMASMIDRSLAGAEEFAARLEHPALRALVKSSLGTARASLDEVRAAIARSFDDSMERVSGWYKRRVQVVTFLIALGAAALANVSVFQAMIVIQKAGYPLANLVDVATRLTSDSDPAKRMETIIKTLPAMPIGWGHADRVMPVGRCQPSAVTNDQPVCMPWREYVVSWPFLVMLFLYPLGWFVTALVATIGAPFWFDILSMLIRLRASGLVPAAQGSRGSAAS